MASSRKQLTFTLAKVTYRQLLDTDGNVLGEEVLNSEDATSSLQLAGSQCSLSQGDTYFRIDAPSTPREYVNLVTRADNTDEVDLDTLIINSTATVDADKQKCAI